MHRHLQINYSGTFMFHHVNTRIEISQRTTSEVSQDQVGNKKWVYGSTSLQWTLNQCKIQTSLTPFLVKR